MGMLSIVSRGDLLRKLNFPKHTIVISSVLGAFINFLINLVVVSSSLWLIRWIGLHTLVIIPLFLEVLVLAMGCALMLSSLFVSIAILDRLGSGSSGRNVRQPDYLLSELPFEGKTFLSLKLWCSIRLPRCCRTCAISSFLLLMSEAGTSWITN